MEALEAVLTRQSVAPTFLGEPGPDDAALARILAAGACAPDHGKLRPWRFIVIRGPARERLGEVFVEALARRQPDAPEAAIEQERTRPLRAPLLIAVAARIASAAPQDSRDRADPVDRGGRAEHPARGARPGLRRQVADRGERLRRARQERARPRAGRPPARLHPSRHRRRLAARGAPRRRARAHRRVARAALTSGLPHRLSHARSRPAPAKLRASSEYSREPDGVVWPRMNSRSFARPSGARSVATAPAAASCR